MASDRGNLSRKMAAILHADVTGSTALVQLDEALAHERINEAFGRFAQSIEQYGGRVHEIRGDALVAEFSRASDAVCAALAFQELQRQVLEHLDDEIIPKVRIGISLGEVIFADGQVTGAGVVLAQRVEQLADPGGLCITAAIHEALPQHMPFDHYDLGEQEVKGFENPVRVYRVALRSRDVIPAPEKTQKPKALNTLGVSAAVATIVLIIAGGLAYWYQPWTPKEEPASVERMAFPLPDKPSIAVLPFSDLSDSDEHTYIAGGLTENIIATLGKTPGLFVIDRGAAARYNDGSIKAHQVSEELGVRYVLKGSVQKSADRLRVTTTLIDTSTGHHVWSERYDRDMTDLFSLQDEITGRIVVELQVNLTEGEQARLKYDSTTNFEAWANFIRASESFYRFTKEDNAKARELLERAVDLDPQYAIAWGWLAWTHWIDARFGYSESREVSFTRAEELAVKAVELDPELADAQSLLGAIHLYKREYDEALDKGRMAIDLSPNNAVIHATFAITTYSVGNWGETIELLKRAMRLSPYYPSWFLLYLGRAQTFQGDYKEAIATHEKGLARAESPYTKSGFHAALAFAHMEAGNVQRAREFMAQTLEVIPHYSASYVKKTNFFKDPNDLDRLIGALQKAGMTEHPPLELPDKPSIAVLPFNNLSGDPEKEYMADGMTEHIISSLARIPEMFVVARNSTFVYKDKPVEVRKVAQDLGVQYVLEGSMQTSANRIRVTAQLIDALSGLHVWSEQYDRELTDFFALQDDITRQIAVSMLAELAWGESAYIQASSATDLKAWLFLQQAYADFRRYTPDGNRKARDLIQKALDRDPNYADALAFMSWTHIIDTRLGYSESRSESLKLASEFAEKVASVDPEHLELYYIHALVHMIKGEMDKAVENGEKLVDAAPGSAEYTAGFSMILYFAGEFDRSIELMNKATRMSPHYPAWYDLYLGRSYAMKGDYDSAEEVFSRLTNDRTPVVLAAGGHVGKAFVYVETGRDDQARDQIKKALAKVKWLTVSFYKGLSHFKDPANWQRVETALLTAGLPN